MGGKAQAAFVGANGAVELHPIAPVYMDLAGVVRPGHPELDGALRLGEPLQQAHLFIFGVLIDHRLQAGEDLFYGLDELRLVGVTLFYLFQN